MIEIHLGTRGASANVDGQWRKSSSPAELVRSLMAAGHNDSVRVHAGYGDAYIEFPSLDAALRGLSAPPSPEYAPRPTGLHYGAAEIWDPERRRWVRPERPSP